VVVFVFVWKKKNDGDYCWLYGYYWWWFFHHDVVWHERVIQKGFGLFGFGCAVAGEV